jgi:hypothetical protein
MVGFETTQRKGGITDAYSDRFVPGVPMRNHAQGFTFDETEFEQAQTNISALVCGNSGTDVVDDYVYIHANAT